MADIDAKPWPRAKLGQFLANRTESLTPSLTPEEAFELYSVPSFETGQPERIQGKEIGSAKQFVSPGDVLLCKINPRINRVWIVSDRSEGRQIASTEWIRFPRHQKLVPRYLSYHLQREGVRAHLAMHASGVGGSLMRVKPATIANEELPLPPPETQQRIVARIDELFAELDDGETAMARARGELEIYRKALLKAAVTGELTADWRAANSVQETGADLVRRIHTERRKRWDANTKNNRKEFRATEAPASDSRIPPGWSQATLESLSIEEPRNGLSVKESTELTAVRSLRLGALTDDGINWFDHRYLPVQPQEVAKYRLQTGDLLVSRANGSPAFVGRCSLCVDPPSDMIFPDTAIRYRLGGEESFWAWVSACWRSPTLRQSLLKTAKSTAGILKVSQQDIRSVLVPIPPESEMREASLRIAQGMSVITELGDVISMSEAGLRIARQSILAAAFRGDLVQ